MTSNPIDDTEICFHLLLYSEPPTSPLRRPRDEWGDVEHIAADMIELLALIESVQFNDDRRAVATRLAAVDAQQVRRFDAALAAIGNSQQRRALAFVQRELIESVAPLGTAERVDAIAARVAADPPLFVGTRYRVDRSALQRSLFDFLIAKQALPAELPAYDRPATVPSDWQIPKSPTRTDAHSGTRNLFLLDTDEATLAGIDSWLRNQLGTRLHAAKRSTPVKSYAEIVDPGKSARRMLLAGSIVGETHSPAIAVDYLHDHWHFGRDQPPADALDRIARDFCWALFQWSYIARSELLAFLTDDERLADRFEDLLNASGVTPVSTIRRAGELADVANGIAFRELDSYGEAPLAAAAQDGCDPWLVIAAQDEPGYWWRTITARLRPQFSHWTGEYGRPLLMLAFRNIDTDTWRALWSRLDLDDNAAVFAISGCVPEHVLRERLASVKTSVSIDGLRLLAGSDGWAYAHVWGGGSSEHYAVFFATDPTATARVADFSRRQWPSLARYNAFW